MFASSWPIESVPSMSVRPSTRAAAIPTPMPRRSVENRPTNPSDTKNGTTDKTVVPLAGATA